MNEHQIVTRVEQPDFQSHEPPPVIYRMPQPVQPSPVVQGGRSLTALFGLHVAGAALTVMVDLMVFGSDVFSAGLLIPVGIVIAVILGFIIYRIQRFWYGDSHEAALTKALVIGLLTAIPVPLTTIIAIPTGALGLVHTLSRRK